MSYISLNNVSRSFGKFQALNKINLDLETDTQYVIKGSSGSGKSTLLYLIGGLDRPTEGNIKIGGEDIAEMTDEELALFRNREVGFVFQFHFLLPSMSCWDNIMLPAKIGDISAKSIKKRANELVDYLGVGHCLKKYPYQISGGEQQRINIVRALSLGPKLLLCDEPTGNLDSENSDKVVNLLRQLSTSSKSTLVIVTHDMGIAQTFDNQINIRDGKLQLNSH